MLNSYEALQSLMNFPEEYTEDKRGSRVKVGDVDAVLISRYTVTMGQPITTSTTTSTPDQHSAVVSSTVSHIILCS